MADTSSSAAPVAARRESHTRKRSAGTPRHAADTIASSKKRREKKKSGDFSKSRAKSVSARSPKGSRTARAQTATTAQRQSRPKSSSIHTPKASSSSASHARTTSKASAGSTHSDPKQAIHITENDGDADAEDAALANELATFEKMEQQLRDRERRLLEKQATGDAAVAHLRQLEKQLEAAEKDAQSNEKLAGSQRLSLKWVQNQQGGDSAPHPVLVASLSSSSDLTEEKEMSVSLHSTSHSHLNDLSRTEFSISVGGGGPGDDSLTESTDGEEQGEQQEDEEDEDDDDQQGEEDDDVEVSELREVSIIDSRLEPSVYDSMHDDDRDVSISIASSPPARPRPAAALANRANDDGLLARAPSGSSFASPLSQTSPHLNLQLHAGAGAGPGAGETGEPGGEADDALSSTMPMSGSYGLPAVVMEEGVTGEGAHADGQTTAPGPLARASTDTTQHRSTPSHRRSKTSGDTSEYSSAQTSLRSSALPSVQTSARTSARTSALTSATGTRRSSRNATGRSSPTSMSASGKRKKKSKGKKKVTLMMRLAAASKDFGDHSTCDKECVYGFAHCPKLSLERQSRAAQVRARVHATYKKAVKQANKQHAKRVRYLRKYRVREEETLTLIREELLLAKTKQFELRRQWLETQRQRQAAQKLAERDRKQELARVRKNWVDYVQRVENERSISSKQEKVAALEESLSREKRDEFLRKRRESRAKLEANIDKRMQLQQQQEQKAEAILQRTASQPVVARSPSLSFASPLQRNNSDTTLRSPSLLTRQVSIPLSFIDERPFMVTKHDTHITANI